MAERKRDELTNMKLDLAYHCNNWSWARSGGLCKVFAFAIEFTFAWLLVKIEMLKSHWPIAHQNMLLISVTQPKCNSFRKSIQNKYLRFLIFANHHLCLYSRIKYMVAAQCQLYSFNQWSYWTLKIEAGVCYNPFNKPYSANT